MRPLPPCVLFEDEDLLVINKPDGLNTHSPSPFAGEGVYEWLKNREPRWSELAILHRLDKETSGVMVFGKTTLANRSLTEQFSTRKVRKSYFFLSDHAVAQNEWAVRSALVRVGDRYQIRPEHAGAEIAETRFRLIECRQGKSLIAAEPLTGKTHQIRVHAASCDLPILGDELYGGSRWPRLCLHAEAISFRHPRTEVPVDFCVPADFETKAHASIRSAIIDSTTDAFRLVHGFSDGSPGVFVDRLGDFLLVQSDRALAQSERDQFESMAKRYSCRGVYHKILSKQVRGKGAADSSPKWIAGEVAPDRFTVKENGVNFELGFGEGYSVGLFLDQRENRRRLLTGYVGAGFAVPLSGLEVLNTFAYTCAFSVAAALAGARTTSLDLSKKYLEWGRRNFDLNGVKEGQDFIFGDTFDWLKRFVRKKRQFDMVLLDPPTFSQSHESGVFQAERDYGKLVTAALAVLKPDGILFCSTNASRTKPETFLEQIRASIHAQGRRVSQMHYVPQPADFPISRLEPAYLKTVWLRVA